MTSKKFGLGKGLSALIPEESIEDGVTENNSISFVDLNLIRANEEQPRRNFDQEKIVQLCESIKEHGIIQPIVLQKQDKAYVVVAGERRWRAAKLAGLKEVPAVIMDLNHQQVLEISLIENIQREDLNPIEEASAYKRLIEDFSLVHEDLAKKIGKSRTAITNSLRLLKLDKRVQNYIIESIITEGHGRALLGISDLDLQYKLSQEIIDNNLSVREIEKIIKNYNNEHNINVKEKNTNENNPYYFDLQNKLENYFGTKVKINLQKDKGKIQIDYYSDEDLQRIIDILNI